MADAPTFLDLAREFVALLGSAAVVVALAAVLFDHLGGGGGTT